MARFSANLGFLWKDFPITEAIFAAKLAGFDAVECHWPYETPARDVKAALKSTGLPMISLNTRRGDVSRGESGLAAVPNRQTDARAGIDEALAYGAAVGVRAVHVLAGVADGEDAHATFLENLKYASDQAMPRGLDIVIEPLNRHDAPGYFLRTTEQARDVISEVGATNLKLMFDCYHVGRTEGDITTRLKELIPIIGHIQFASIPERGPPNQGEVDFETVFSAIDSLGWDQPLGAEYRPGGPTEESLDWLSALKS